MSIRIKRETEREREKETKRQRQRERQREEKYLKMFNLYLFMPSLQCKTFSCGITISMIFNRSQPAITLYPLRLYHQSST